LLLEPVTARPEGTRVAFDEMLTNRGEAMLKNNHPTLAWVLDYWPVVLGIPALLLMVAVLALVTLWWDRRDESARQRADGARTGCARPQTPDRAW